jgi:hypothetical protein
LLLCNGRRGVYKNEKKRKKEEIDITKSGKGSFYLPGVFRL